MSRVTREELLSLAEEYLTGTVNTNHDRGLLARRLYPFLEEYPGERFLPTLQTTEALIGWVIQPQFLNSSKSGRWLFLRALRGFSSWLFKRGIVEHNVHFYVNTEHVLRTGEIPDLVLKFNLQRAIARFETDCPPRSVKMKTTIRAAHQFNRYRNQRGNLEIFGEELLVGWLRVTSSSCTAKVTASLLHGLARFSESVGASSSLPDVRKWLAGYRSCRAVTRNLGDLSQVSRVRFRSGLSNLFESYLKFCEGRKMQLRCIEVHLRALDRIALGQGIGAPEELTRSMLLEFLEENEVTPATFNLRLSWLRGFRRYLIRKGVQLDWPGGLSPRPVPPFRPHLYSLSEIGQILETLEHLGRVGRRDAFYWRAVKLVVFLLYAGGMRLSEPIRLRIKDVIPDGHLLFIRETKFYKQRWVPLGPRAWQRLASYFEERCRRYPEKCAPGDPFFLSSRASFLSTSSLQGPFREALDTLRLKGRGTRSRPRLHDLRHTAAVHKLYQWYCQGKDVQNKLPLLSTYLGHVSLQSTEKYLHLTEDLLRLAGGNFRVSFEKIVGSVEVG